uniref:Putative ATPase subunit of terminase n=1 Tax=Otarine gammaherpesvirus 4 TaxID=2801541 RepID=A0A889IVZ9_9GAMA|nr:putative ATPase subunit of terminase [Otarine gammaherpesvirus 4]
MLYVDEANFIKKDALPAILGFMLQKDAKVIFISSANSSDQATSFLFKLRNAGERMLSVVSYVCEQHRDDFNLQDAVVSCPCYRLHIPSYITINENVKSTANLFLEGAFSTELMGDAGASQTAVHRIVSEAAVAQFDLCRVDTTKQEVAAQLDTTLYVYIDPAYTNNSEASGTGVAAVVGVQNTHSRTVILGLEHFFLRSLTGAAALEIASCTATMIRSVMVLHPQLREVYVAVEGNSNQDSAVAIATLLDECSPLPVRFIHSQIAGNTGVAPLQRPLFMLGADKAQAFEAFIYALNTGSVSASQVTVSHTVRLSYDPVLYLIEQIRGIRCCPLKDGRYTYCAKQRLLSDDTLVATVMAHYFATSENKYTFSGLHDHTSQHSIYGSGTRNFQLHQQK